MYHTLRLYMNQYNIRVQYVIFHVLVQCKSGVLQKEIVKSISQKNELIIFRNTDYSHREEIV